MSAVCQGLGVSLTLGWPQGCQGCGRLHPFTLSVSFVSSMQVTALVPGPLLPRGPLPIGNRPKNISSLWSGCGASQERPSVLTRSGGILACHWPQRTGWSSRLGGRRAGRREEGTGGWRDGVCRIRKALGEIIMSGVILCALLPGSCKWSSWKTSSCSRWALGLDVFWMRILSLVHFYSLCCIFK